MDVAGNSVVASLLEEVVDVKRTFGALVLTFAHRGISWDLAADLAMHGLPCEEAKAMAERMRDTWPADPWPLRASLVGGRGRRAVRGGMTRHDSTYVSSVT